MNSKIKALRKQLPAARRELLKYPNVIGVGIGMRSDGGCSRDLVWRVYVSSKLLSSRIRAEEAIPKKIFGLGTELVCAQPGRAATKEPPVLTAGTWIESTNAVPSYQVWRRSLSSTGSLGCFAKDASGKFVLLTCAHVLFPEFVALKQLEVYSPDYSSCCSGGERVARPIFDEAQMEDGKYFGGFARAEAQIRVPKPGGEGTGWSSELHRCAATDCAIAALEPGTKFHNVWNTPKGQIAITGVNTAVTDIEDTLKILGPPAGKTPADEQYVRIFTPRDGGKLIYGTVSYHDVDVETGEGVHLAEDRPGDKMVSPIFRHKGLTAKNMLLPYANQIAILPRPMPKPAKPGKPRNYEDDYAQTGQELSIDSGDSGSVVIDFQGRVIAQIVAAGPFDPDVYVRKPEQRSLIEYQALVGKNLGIATPIQAIMDQLHITMLSHPSGFSGTVPSAGTSTRVFLSSASSDRQLEAARLTVVRLRKELGCTRRGKLLLGKIGQHRREVRMLLANVRAISSAWRELNGPAFYHHCFQSASNPRHVIPTCINGTTRDNLVEGLKPLFLIHASPALQRDIRRYGDRAAAALLGISTLDDAPNAVADRWPPQ